MALLIRQGTAKVVSFGPFVDKTDGVTLEVGLVTALDHASTGIKLSKNGGALTIRNATVTATTYDGYGCYRVTLDTTDTGTVGTLRMAFEEAATCLPVWQDLMVLPQQVYDSLVAGTDLLDANVSQWLGTAAATPTTAGVPEVDVTYWAAQLTTASDVAIELQANLVSQSDITGGAYAISTDGTGKVNLAATQTADITGTITTATNLTNWNGISLKKNAAYANFMFVMRDSTNHNPATGKTVVEEVSIDGAAFVNLTNAFAEVASGVYKINLAAADTNGDALMLRFSASGCDDTFFFIRTQS